MSLSTHEIYLILRARDEASGILRSFSSNMGAAEKQAANASIASIQKVRAAAREQYNEQLAHLEGLKREQATLIKGVQSQIDAIRTQQTTEARQAAVRIGQLRDMAAQTGASVSEQVAAIGRLRRASALAAQEQIVDLKAVRAGYAGEVAEIEATIVAMRQQEKAAAAAAASQIASIRETQQAQASLAASAVARGQQTLTKGRTLATAGFGTAITGAAALYGLNAMTKAATEYNQAVAKTATQTDKVNVSLQQLGDMGRQVANTLPVDFHQVQPALYDIFSSIDVNAPQAQKLLKGIGTAAVAGSVDMATAGKAILAIMNAYKMDASQVNEVNDTLFQLVRKGVGTYKDFASTIGLSIPSAVKAGQSIQTLSGMLAFLTRNGLSASRASTSAARALDALSNPKAIAALKSMGVAVTNAKGQFLPLTKIIDQLRTKLDKLSAEGKAAALTDIFKGAGGTIQAMRFFNLAVNDSNNLLNEMVGDMNHAKGAAADAYKVMSNTPEAKIQLLKNRFTSLSTELGDDLIPLKLKLVSALLYLVKAFNSLSPEVKKFITYAVATVAIVLTVGGVVAALSGVVIMLAGAVELAGAGLLGLATAGAPAIAAVAAIVAVVIYAIKNWDKFKQSASDAWTEFLKLLQPVEDAWNRVEPTLVHGTEEIISAISDLVADLQKHSGQIDNIFTGLGKLIQSVMNVIVMAIKVGWPVIVNSITTAITILKPIINVLLTIFSALSSAWNALPASARNVVVALTLIMIAFRGTALAQATYVAGLGKLSAGFGSMVGKVTAQAGLLKSTLAGIGIGFGVGSLAGGHIAGTGGKVVGALGGAAGGALAGAAIGGPWGAAIGGVVGGISGLVSAWHAQGDAAKQAAAEAQAALEAERQKVQNLTAAIQEDNGALGNNTKLALAQQLQQSGVLSAAQKLGIQLSTVTQAAMGNKKAQDELNKVDGKWIELMRQSYTTGIPLTKQQNDMYGAASKVNAAFQDSKTEINKAMKAYQQINEAMATSVKTHKATAEEIEKLSNAEVDWHNSLQAVASAIHANGTALKGNSSAAVANRSAIINAARAAQAHGQALVDSGKSAYYAAAAMRGDINSLIGTARQAGLTNVQIRALLQSMGMLPSQIDIAMNVDTSHVFTQLAAVQAALDAMTHASTDSQVSRIQSLQARLKQLQQVAQAAASAPVSYSAGASGSATGGFNAPGADYNPGGGGSGGGSGSAAKKKDKQDTKWYKFRDIYYQGKKAYDEAVAAFRSNKKKGIVKFGSGKNVGYGYGGQGYDTLYEAHNAMVLAQQQAKKDKAANKWYLYQGEYYQGPEALHAAQAIAKAAQGGISQVGKGKNAVFGFGGQSYKTRQEAHNALIDAAKSGMSDFMGAIAGGTASDDDIAAAEASLNALAKQSGVKKSVIKQLNASEKEMGKWIAKRTANAAALDAANQKLSDLQQQSADFASSVHDSIMATFDITQQTNLSDLIGGLQKAVQNAKDFGTNLQKLSQMGYSPDLIRQLATAGPQAAAAAIHALLQASPDQVKTITDQYSQLGQIATDQSTQLADQFYGSSIKAAQGVVDGLEAQQATIEAEIAKVAAGMVNTLNKALGIKKGKSSVGKDIGMATTNGMVAGLNAGRADVINTARSIADAAAATIRKALKIKSPSGVMHDVGVFMMKGLANGITNGYKHVDAALAATRSDLNAQPFMYGNDKPYGGAPGGGNIVFEAGSVVTQEINPAKSAADLGWELSRRVG